MSDKKMCFVIGPIGDEGSPERIHADWLYRGIILPAFQRDFSEYEVERADTIPTPGMISSQIINRLHDVELVIADLSFHSANAFYEMSIRHKVGKPIIHMILKGEKIPFDVIPHRAIQFLTTHRDDLERAQGRLRDSINEAINPDFEPDNPITHARGRLELQEHAAPAIKVLMNQMESMQSQISYLDGLVRALSRNVIPKAPLLGTGPTMAEIIGGDFRGPPGVQGLLSQLFPDGVPPVPPPKPGSGKTKK
jgi:hypothetical protein